MKLKYELTIVEIEGEYMAIPVGTNVKEFQGMLQLNDVAKDMLECIQESSSPKEAHKKLIERYPEENPIEVGENLCEFLNQLVREGLLQP